jgi:hypothetical protein
MKVLLGVLLGVAIVFGLGLLFRDNSSAPLRDSSVPPMQQKAAESVIKLRCVDEKNSEVFLNIDPPYEMVGYFGDVFYEGKTERSSDGKTYNYFVSFSNDEISFVKYFGKNVVYGGSLDRRTLILKQYLGAGSLVDKDGVASFLMMMASATLPQKHCAVLKKVI